MKFEPYRQPHGWEYNCRRKTLHARGVLDPGEFLTERIPKMEEVDWFDEKELDAYFEEKRDDVLMAIYEAVSGPLYEEYGFEVEPNWKWHYITRGGTLGIHKVDEDGVHIYGVIKLI